MTRTWRALGSVLLMLAVVNGRAAAPFDHQYAAYGAVLKAAIQGDRVDYRQLLAGRAAFDQVVATFTATGRSEVEQWSRPQQMAFWINTYNLLTLKAVVENYPIKSGWFTLSPRNSIQQVDNVWTRPAATVAGRPVSLDDVEHRILRPTFKEPRVHFAINCASISCPPLAVEPYRAETLDQALDAAARRYLATPEGLRLNGDTLSVSSIFKWYGEDFIADYAALGPEGGDQRQRAVLGAVVRFGPTAVAERIKAGGVRLKFLDYNWSLNDVAR